MRPSHVVVVALSILTTAGSAAAAGAKESRKTAATAFPARTNTPSAPTSQPAAPAPAPAVPSAPSPVPVAETQPAAPAEVDRAASEDRAAADAEFAAKPMSVAPLLGMGTNTMNFGFGLRAGYTLPSKVYLGASFVYHLGMSDKLEFLNSGTSLRFMYPAVEVGYEFRFGRLGLRPYGGVAVIVAHSSTTYADGHEVSDSVASPGFYPGVTLTYDVPKSSVFVGGDARMLVNLDSSAATSFGLFGTAGMRF